MRAAIAIVGAAVIVAGGAGIWVVTRPQLAPPAPTAPASSSPAPEEPGPLPVTAGASWRTFRGDRAFSGVASGELPDRLKLYWRFETGGAVKSSPVIADGRVFVGSDDGHLYALDLATGDKLWSYKTGDAVEAPPLLVEDRVIVGSADANLYCFTTSDGELKWTYSTDGRILGTANWTRAPETGETLILAGSYDFDVHCVDLATGVGVWTYQTESYVTNGPAISGGAGAFGSCDQLLHVISPADGESLAAIETGGAIVAAAAGREGRFFVGNYAGQLICADVAGGKIVWTYEPSDDPFVSPPAVTPDRVVIGSRDGRVHCVSADTGDPLWTFRTRNQVDSGPVICGDKVLVASTDGRVYILRMADGTEISSYDLGDSIVSSPAVAGGAVVVGCEDGFVYAFGSAGP